MTDLPVGPNISPGPGVRAIVASDATFTGTVVLSGGANVTVGTDGQTITISGGAGGGGNFTGGVSDLGNTAGTTGTVSARVVLVGSDNITLSQSKNDGASATISIIGPAPGAGAAFTGGVSTGGNTVGDTGTVSNRLILAGGNRITLSQATAAGGATVTLSGPNAQTGISSIVASDATYTSGSVQFTGSGAATVKSSANQRVVIDVPVQSEQAETQTFIAGVSVSDTLYTSGDVRITGVGGGITVSSNTGQRIDLSVAAPVAQSGTQFSGGLSNIGNTAGDTGTVAGRLVLAGGNRVTLSGSTNGVSETVTISVPNAQTAVSGIANSQTTYTSGTVSLSELGAITIRSTTGNQYQFSVNSQTAQTGISSIAASDTTYTSGSVQFTGSNMVTVKSSANQRVVIDATQTVQTQNLHNVTLSGNTAGAMAHISSGTMTLAGGNNITLSQAGNAVTISGGAGAGGFAGGGISGGNTSGDTGSVTGRLIFAGDPSITLSGSTNAGSMTVTVSAPATSSLSASTNITLSVDVSTIKFSVADPPKLHQWQNRGLKECSAITNVGAISKTAYYFPEEILGRVTLNSVGFHVSHVTANTLQSFVVHLGIYTFVNSTSAALLGSASDSYNVSSASSVSFSAQRQYVMTSPASVAGISNLTPGNYLFGIMFSGGATQSMNFSIYGDVNTAVQPMGIIRPGANQLSTGTSQGLRPFCGPASVTINAFPANVVASEIRNQGSGAGSVAIHPWLYIRS